MIDIFETRKNVYFVGGYNIQKKDLGMPMAFQSFVPQDVITMKRNAFRNDWIVSDDDNHKMMNILVKKWAVQGKISPKGLTDFERDCLLGGYVPNTMNLHHKIPLTFGGENTEDNFSIINRDVHNYLHWVIYSPLVREINQYMKKRHQKPMTVVFPKLPLVVPNIETLYPILMTEEIRDFYQFFIAQNNEYNMTMKRRRIASFVSQQKERAG